MSSFKLLDFLGHLHPTEMTGTNQTVISTAPMDRKGV